MAASTEQKLDYLLKKIGYTASKTGLAEDSSLSGTKKSPFAESIPSPLVTASSSIWTDSNNIPTTPPGSDSSSVKVYLAGTSGHRMTADSTVSGSRAFIAYSTYNNTSTAILGDWIDTQFGDSYIIKVYKGDPNSGGTLLSAAGSGSNDTWFFDYASGVLNFNGTVVPSGVTDTNIYIVGYRYIGAKGTATAGINTTGTSFFEDIVVGGNAGIGSLNVTGVSTVQDLQVKGNNILLDHGGSMSGVTTIGSYYEDKLDIWAGIGRQLIPYNYDTQDLGDTSFRWRDGYIAKVKTEEVSGINMVTAGIGSTHVNLDVVVNTKNTDHRYYNQGSSDGYVITTKSHENAGGHGIQSPFFTFTPGRKYRFNQSDNSNNTYQIKFYLEADKTTLYETGVTYNGTAGSSGAYTQIEVTDQTPSVLFYQSVNNAYMGNAFQTNANVINTNYDAKLSGNLNVTGITTVGFATATDVWVSGAVTATTFKGDLTGTASTATSINVTFNSQNEWTYLLFADGNSGYQEPEAHSSLKFNPSTGKLYATSFTGDVIGDLTGTVNTAAQPNITSLGTLTSLDVTGNVSIGGTLTYDDVTNVDSIGIITARSGVKVTSGGIDVTGVSTFGGAIDANSTLEVSGIANFDSTVKIGDKIEHLGDDNTNIRFPDADTFAVETAGNERLRITSAGALQLSDTNSPNDKNTDIWVADDVLNFNAFGTNGAFIFKSGSSSTERLRIDSSGQIGINTTPKTWQLGKAIHIGVAENAIWGEADYALHIIQNAYYNSGYKYTHTDEATLYSQENGKHSFKVAASGTADSAITWVNALCITSDGKVGINTTNPGSKLEVWADDSDTDTDVFSVRGKTSAFNIRVDDADAANPTWTLRSYSTEPIAFAQGTDERLRIDSSGNTKVTGQFEVTTGANSFLTSANVFKGTAGQLGVYLRSALSSATTPSYSSVDDTDTGIFLPGSDVFAVTTGGSERLRITSGGNVAIGTDDPGLATYGDDLTIARTTHAGITLRTGTGHKGTIYFSDGTSGGNEYEGSVQYDHSDRTLRFASGGTRRVDIDHTGDVKFWGTTNANSANKNVNLTAPSWNTGEEDVNLVQVENEETSNQISFGGGTSGLNAATQLIFRTASAVNNVTGTERLRITSEGYVQVKTYGSATTGGAPLYVGVTAKDSINYGGGQDDTACVRIEDVGSSNGYYHGLELRTKRSGDVRIYAHDVGDNIADLVFATDNGGLQESLRILSDGKVGIGITNPATKFVVSNDGAEGLEVSHASGTVEVNAYKRSDSSRSPFEITAQTFKLSTGNPSLNVGLYQDSTGKVGINETNPAAYGAFVAKGTGNIVSLNASSGAASLSFFENGTGRFYIKTLNGSDGLAFVDADNSTERLRITSAGLVGINSTSPSSAQLVIHNSDDSNLNSIDVYNDNGNLSSSISQDSNGAGAFLQKDNSGTVKTFIRAYDDSYFLGGNIGIGTDNPGSLLTLDHATNPAIQFKDSGTKVASINAEGTQTNIASFESKDLVFATSTSSAFTERLRITSDGKVGIGTDNPNNPLTVYASGNHIYLKDTATNNVLQIRHAAGVAEFNTFGTGGARKDYVFNQYTTEVLRINSSGLVGIGTDNPENGLHVSDGSSYAAPQNTGAGKVMIEHASSADLQFMTANSGYNHIFFGDQDDANIGSIVYHHASNANAMVFNTNTAEALRITSSGVLKLTGQSTSFETAGLTHHTNNNLYIRGGTTGAILQSVDGQEAWIVQNDYVAASTGDEERLRITGIGSVGINNTSPATIVDITSAKASDGLTITKGSNVAAFLGHNGTGDEGILSLKDSGTTNIQIYAETGQVSYFNAGNVGIGTINPTSLLTVGARPKTTSTAATVLISPASGNASIQLRGGSPTLEFDGTGGGNGQIFTDSADLTINDGTLDGSGNEILRITSARDVLIGTNTNAGGNRLYVVDNFTDAYVNPSDSIVRIENSNTSGTTGQASISFTSKTSGSNADSAIVSQAEDASGNARLEFWTDTANGMTEKMAITSSGSVLIGTAITAHAGIITATKFVTSTGTSGQFVKGDGSLDSSNYILEGDADLDLVLGNGNSTTKGMQVGLTTFSDNITVNGTTSTFNGDIYSRSLTLTDNGTSADPLLLIKTDDTGPWAFQVRNDTYGTGSQGFKVYQSNAGVNYIQTRGTSARGRLIMQQHNGTTTNDMIEFTEAGEVKLQYQGNERLRTTGIGVSVIGVGNTAYIEGPGEIWIDPHPFGVGTTSGIVRVRGDLYVDGKEFIVDVDKIELGDFQIGIATTAGTNLLLDGAGIGIGSESIRKTLTWDNSSEALKSSEHFDLASGKRYKINGNGVISANALGSGIVNSSLTSVGTLGSLNVSGLSTFGDNLDVNANINVSGGITNSGGNISLLDRPDGNSQNLFFGTGAKAAAYHDGTNFTVINNTGHTYIGIGAANKDLMLYAQSTGNIILQRNTGHKYFEGVGSDGTAKIYHNTNEKIRTTPTGVVVTGILTATQIADSNNSVGSASSVLSSTGSGLEWVAQSGGGGGGGAAGLWQQTDVGINTVSKVGIGTTSPNYKLEVSGTNNNSYLSLENTTAADTDGSRYSRILFRGFQSGGELSSLAAINGAHDGTADDQKGRISFRTNDGSDGESPTERLRINSTGGVVIRHNGATASDGYAGLEVRANKDKYQLVLASNSAAADTNKATLGFKVHNSGQEERVKAAIIVQGDGGAYGEVDYMSFCLDAAADNGNAASADEKLRINSSGQTLINQTSAGDSAVMLGVKNPTDNGTVIDVVCGNTTAGSHISFSDDNYAAGLISYDHTNNFLAFRTNGVTSDRLHIASDGQVRIGTTATGTASVVIDSALGSGSVLRFIGKSSNDGSEIDFYANDNSTRLGYIEFNDEVTKIVSETDVPFKITTNGGSNERLRITSNGTVIAGATSVSAGNRSQYSILAAVSNNTSETGHGVFTIQAGANSSSGNEVAQLCFSDPQGDYAWIQAFADAETGAADKPGRLVFSTTADGATVPTERLRIDSSGRALLGTQKTYGNYSYYDDITINNSNGATNELGGTGITLISKNTSWNALLFGDSDDNGIGAIKYDHGNNHMRFVVNGNDPTLYINSSGNVGIGTDNPGNFNAAADNLVVGTGVGHNGITINSAADGDGWLVFNDAANTTLSGAIQYNHVSDYMAFRTGGATNEDRLRIHSGGNIGIGTDTDSTQRLAVYGTNAAIMLQNPNTGTGANNGFYMGNGNGTIAYLWNYENEAIRFATSDTEKFRIDKDGRVVISNNAGGHAGGSQFVVMGGAINNYASAAFGNYTAAPGDGDTFAMFRFNSGSTGTSRGAELIAAADADWTAGSSYPTRLVFSTTASSATSSTERLRIDSSGNVGINETSPRHHLTVNSGTTNVAIAVSSTDAGSFISYQDNTTGDTGTNSEVYAGATGGSFVIHTDAQTTPRVTVTNGGNIGIGSAIPTEKLDVAGNVSLGETLTITGNNPNITFVDSDNNPDYKIYASNGAFTIQDGTSSKFIISSTGTKTIQNGNLNISSTYIDFSGDVSTPSTAAAIYRPADNTLAFSTANEERLRITSTGNVGIGTNNPESGQLQVVGGGYHSINITGNKTADANKTSGISFLNYEGDRTSVFQTYASSSSSTIYYGSADSSARGVQYHNFYVNASRTATTNHKLALRINSSGNLEIGGNDAAQSILLYEGQNSPSNGDSCGAINWGSRTDKTVTASIRAAAFDNTNGTDAYLTFHTAVDTANGDSQYHLSEKLRINSNSQLLHTRTDNVQRYDLEFRNTGGIGDGNYGGIHWTQGSTGSTNLAAIEIAYADSGRPDIVFKNRQSGGTSISEALRILSDGKVGIGITDPQNLLDLYQSSGNTTIGVKAYGGNDAQIELVETGGTAIDFGETGAAGFRISYHGGDNKLYFTSGSDTTVNTRLSIDRDTGNVGIGSDTLTSQLEIKRANVSGTYPNGNAKPSGASIWNDGGDIFTGRLFLQGSALSANASFLTGFNNEGTGFVLYDYSQSKYMQKWFKEAQTELYYNGTERFRTTDNGVTIYEDTDKVVRFTGGIGEIGSVTGFQATNTAGTALTSFGMRATDLRFATGASERLRITSDGNLKLPDSGKIELGGVQTGSGDLQIYHSTQNYVDIADGQILYFREGGDNKFYVQPGGAQFVGSLYADDDNKIELGDDQELQIYHDNGSWSYIDNKASNNFVIRVNGTDNSLVSIPNGKTSLYNSGDESFRTTGIGVSVIGVGNTAYIEGPSEIWIDPHPSGGGEDSGIVRIKGDLYVDGTEFIVDVDKLEIGDFQIGIASTAGTNAVLDGAGIGIGSESIRKTITWNNATSALMSSENWNLASGKHYEIAGTDVLTSTTLGSGVVNSSLTSVGTLSAVTVSGTAEFDGQVNFDNGDDAGKDLQWQPTSDRLAFFDDVKATFGNSANFEIYQSGNHSYMIHSNASGNYFIRSSKNLALQSGGATTGIDLNADGWVALNYSGSEKLKTNNAGVVITGIATATDFDSTSDIRLKTNIKPIDDPLAKVIQIEGVSFNWKENNRPALGVIADQVEEIIPELVHGDDPKTVNYNGLIGLLIEAVKEQQIQIDSLKNRLSKLE